MKKKFIKMILGFSIAYFFVACAPTSNSAMNDQKVDLQNAEMASTMIISDSWARATAKGQATSAVYLHLYNPGQQTEYLLSAASNVAEKVEIHLAKMVDGMMTMRPVKHVEIGADQIVELKSGSYHIMLIGLKKALDDGARIPLTLTFKNTGKKLFYVPVKKMMLMPMNHQQQGMKSQSQNMKRSE